MKHLLPILPPCVGGLVHFDRKVGGDGVDKPSVTHRYMPVSRS